MSVSRRQVLLGRLFGRAPEPQSVVEQVKVNDLLARARRPAPWEKPTPADPSTIAPGHKARIMVFDCLAHQSSPCTTCRERCPEAGAIVLDAQQRPTVDVARCTGCGDCAAACPAPRTAIAIGPEAS